MRPIWLIGVNLIRAQRMTLIGIIAWIFGMHILMLWIDRSSSHALEAIAVVRIQAVYGVLIVLSLGATVIYNELRSRRIVAVLSKGIHRGQYLAGLLCGIVLLAAFYFGLLIALYAPMLHGWRVTGVLATIFLAAILAGAAALFFGCFLHPLLATACAGIVLAIPFVVSVPTPALELLFPAGGAVLGITGTRAVSWPLVAASCAVQIAFFWLAASAAFARRDVTLAVD
jgi:hypothetical protein